MITRERSPESHTQREKAGWERGKLSKKNRGKKKRRSVGEKESSLKKCETEKETNKTEEDFGA